MTNRLSRLTFVFIALGLVAFEFAPLTQARDITTSIGDSTTQALANEHTVLEVRKAIAFCRNGEFAKAVPILQDYSDKGDVGATYVLAKLYSNGLGVARSFDTAIRLFTLNAESGHTPSMMGLAALKETSNPAEALSLMKQAASEGDLAAVSRLGLIYENGQLGVSKNARLAFNYFEKASDSGFAIAKFHLARFYDDGISVSANEIQSTRLYRQAALGGVSVANTVMAKRYFEGKGVEADPIAGIGWLTRGALYGSPEAMVILGDRYQLGDTIPKDLNRAGKLYSQAAQMGDPGGIYKLAMMYKSGTGTTPDPIRAYVLLSDPRAQVLPQSKSLYLELKNQLTPQQLATANEKIKQQTKETTQK